MEFAYKQFRCDVDVFRKDEDILLRFYDKTKEQSENEIINLVIVDPGRGIEKMVIKPAKVHMGEYSVHEAPADWRKYIYDSENRVFEVMDSLELRHCGKIDGFAKDKGFGCISFHPYKELAAFTTVDGMAVSDFHGNHILE